MYIVTVEIQASPSKYWARLEFLDKTGRLHEKEIEAVRKATQNSNILKALEEALISLQCPCMININTDSDYLTGAIRNGWLTTWQQNGWKNAKGKTIGNVEQWRRVTELLAAHSYKIIRTESKNDTGRI
ncbi:RNase H family protein [Hungatella hathewayi]|uniref:RNase H family protein n=1 Tax=Hungatella hathewayi TaxID=154046 RepID=UPI003563B295